MISWDISDTFVIDDERSMRVKRTVRSVETSSEIVKFEFELEVAAAGNPEAEMTRGDTAREMGVMYDERPSVEVDI